MRLIDADALIEHLRKDPLFALVEQYGITGVIEAAPTIELNQCKNCVHYSEDIAICYYHNSRKMPEAFCSDGERLVK